MVALGSLQIPPPQSTPTWRLRLQHPVACLPACAPSAAHALHLQVAGCLERGIEAVSWSSETPEPRKVQNLLHT